MTFRSLRPLSLGALFLAAGATAQSAVVDEGSFEISIRGAVIGNETFTIRRSGSGANATTVAQGRVTLDTGEQTRVVLQLQGPQLRPTAYQIEVTGDNRQNITGRATGRRIRATVVSASGEQMREYLVDPGAVILHDEVIYPHYFVARAMDQSGRIPVISPTQSRQTTATVEFGPEESINVAGRQITARTLQIQVPGLDNRTVWVDGQDRVLRIRIPGQELTAVRTSAP